MAFFVYHKDMKTIDFANKDEVSFYCFDVDLTVSLEIAGSVSVQDNVPESADTAIADTALASVIDSINKASGEYRLDALATFNDTFCAAANEAIKTTCGVDAETTISYIRPTDESYQELRAAMERKIKRQMLGL